MRIKELLATALCVYSLPALADTSIQLLGYSTTTGEFQLIITGDVVPVTLTLSSLALDWCKPGGELGTVATPTSPNLGVPNGDGVSAASVLLTGPVTTICDIDPNQAFPGATATVAGVTKPLALNAVTVFGVTPNPPPDPQLGSSTLSWMPPTTNTDGSPLTNLAGYQVYWGTAQGSYPNVRSVGNVTTYVVDALSPGTWYFVVTAMNTSMVESAFSSVVSKTIPGGPPPPPPPPPVDPCVADPLTFSVQTWPSATTGRRTFSYTTNKQADVSHRWLPQRGVAVDTRGCTVTVTR